MSNAFTKLSQDKLNAAVADLLCPRIETILGDRGPGHCMRVTDLDDDVMESVCKELRATRPTETFYLVAMTKKACFPGDFLPSWWNFVTLTERRAAPAFVDLHTDLAPYQRRGFLWRGQPSRAGSPVFTRPDRSLLDRSRQTLVGPCPRSLGILTERGMALLTMFPSCCIFSPRSKTGLMEKPSGPACMN